MVNSFDDKPIQNSTYARDYEYNIQLNRWFLKPIGLWPRVSNSSTTEKVLAIVLNVACHVLITLTFVPCLLFILFEETSLQTRLKAIGPMSHWLMGELNYCFLTMRGQDILHCVERIGNDWQIVKRASDREMMLKNVKVGRLIACLAAIGMNLGVFSYIVIGFRKIVFRVGNESFFMYRLPCPVYTKLLNVRLSPANEIVFALQVLSGFIVNSVTVGACGLAAILAMHACGQLNVMMSRLDELVGTGEEEQRIVKQKLGAIVEHHLRTLSFVWYIEKIMNLICLVELVGCTLNICVLEYYFITETLRVVVLHLITLRVVYNYIPYKMSYDLRVMVHPITSYVMITDFLYRIEKSKDTLASYAIIYASMSFNIFIFCYIGETLTEQCKKVGEKAYTVEWYRLSHRTALSLVMIISRSSMVIKITAGKFIRISLATFGDVLKTSFTYFNMLRTIAI